jgi:hypothetical protein
MLMIKYSGFYGVESVVSIIIDSITLSLYPVNSLIIFSPMLKLKFQILTVLSLHLFFVLNN